MISNSKGKVKYLINYQHVRLE